MAILREMFFGARMYFVYVIFTLYVAAMLWWGKKTVTIRAIPIWIILWMYLFAVVSTNLLYYFHPLGAHSGVAFFFAQPSILTKFGLLLIAFISVILIGVSFGSYILDKVSLKGDTKLQEFLYALAAGWIVLSMLLFVLAAVGALRSVVVIPLVVVGLLLARRECRYWIDTALTYRFTVSFPLISVQALSLILIHTMLAISLHEAVFPFPWNWDGMYRYLNTVQLITESGHHITGIFPYPYELIVSTGPLFFKSMVVGVGFMWFSIWLAGLALYTYARTLLKSSVSSLVAAAFFCIPMVYYLMSMETKIDFAAIFYVIIALLALTQWVKEKKYPWLLFAAVLIGFACTIKYTVAFFLPAFLFMMGYWHWKHHHNSKQLIKTIVVVFSVIMLPFLPWLSKHLVEARGDISLHSIAQGGFDGPDFGACGITEEEHYLTLDRGGSETPDISFTGHREEIGRYWGYAPKTLTSWLIVPWMLTMNTTVSHSLVEIGPLFLVLLPAFLLFYRKPPILTHELRAWRYPLAIATVLAWATWLFLGQGITWYVFPGLMLYLLLIGLLWQSLEQNRVLYWVTGVIIVVSLFVTYQHRFIMTSQPAKVQFLSGYKTANEVLYAEPPNIQALADIINGDAPTDTEPKYVYNAGSYIIYRIARNDQRIYNDHFMDSLTCLLSAHEEDYDATLEDLKQRGFKYFVFNPDITLIDETPEQSLVEKGWRVATFITAMADAGKLERIAIATQQKMRHIAYKISE